MNVSLLFRGVSCKLPRVALGWDTGTVAISAPIHLTLTPSNDSSSPPVNKLASKLVISTTDSVETLPADSTSDTVGADVVWDFSADQLRLPVYNRYATALTFEISGGSFLSKKSPQAIAVLWLKDLVDNEEQDIEIPVVTGKDLRQLRQNVIYELEHSSSLKTNLHPFTSKMHDFQIIGHIRTCIRLNRGLDEVRLSIHINRRLFSLRLTGPRISRKDTSPAPRF